MLRYLFGRILNIENGEIRWDIINQVIDDSILVTPGKDLNEQYEGQLKYITNYKQLTKDEKEKAKQEITWNKDYTNLVELKGPRYPCERCYQQSLTISSCEHCIRNMLRSQFNNWTSGNVSIDKAIQDCQLKCPLPDAIIEWIPYQDFTDITYKTKGGSSLIYTATWQKGFIKSFDKKTPQFIRSRPWNVILKRIAKSNQPNEKFLKEVNL